MFKIVIIMYIALNLGRIWTEDLLRNKLALKYIEAGYPTIFGIVLLEQ